MSFAVWVQWFEDGRPATIPIAVVERVFSASVTRRDDSRWQLRHGDRDLCELHLQFREPQEVVALTVSHPCDAPPLWNSILEVLRERHGVCYWPGGAVVASQEASAQLPEDMRMSLGDLDVLASGANIAEAVAHS